jgi:hypothetical protein
MTYNPFELSLEQKLQLTITANTITELPRAALEEFLLSQIKYKYIAMNMCGLSMKGELEKAILDHQQRQQTGE